MATCRRTPRGFDEREDEAWRRAIDGTLELTATSREAYYADCVFFRPAGVKASSEPMAYATGGGLRAIEDAIWRAAAPEGSSTP
jgi:hypothetical protein